MTAVHPDTSQQAVVEAALVLLKRMGLTPADLTAVPQHRKAVQCGIDAEPIGARRGDVGQELLFIPVRDLVVSRCQRHRHPPGLLASPGINAIPRTTRQHQTACPDR